MCVCVYFRLNVAFAKIQSKIDGTRDGQNKRIYLVNRFMRETVNVTLTRYGNTSRISSTPSFREVSLENLPDAAHRRVCSLAISAGIYWDRGRRKGDERGGKREGKGANVSKDPSLYYDLRGFLQ